MASKYAQIKAEQILAKIVFRPHEPADDSYRARKLAEEIDRIVNQVAETIERRKTNDTNCKPAGKRTNDGHAASYPIYAATLKADGSPATYTKVDGEIPQGLADWPTKDG